MSWWRWATVCGVLVASAAATRAAEPLESTAPGAGSPAASGGCTATAPGELLGDSIAVVADPSLPPGVLAQALAAWRSCPAAGEGFPAFAAGGAGRSEVRVRYVAGSSQDGRCGVFRGNEIVLFGSAFDRTGRVVPCGPPAVNLAHELGHVLGLRDAPRRASCRGVIMSGDDPAAPTGERRVQAAECAAADRHWRTPAEGAVLASTWLRVGDAETGFVPLDAGPVAGDASLAAPRPAFEQAAAPCGGVPVASWRSYEEPCRNSP